MPKTVSLRSARRFFTKNYHENIHVRGERAMDTLMGTMIGVLFLAVITASFAGIYMAYVVSTAKSEENTSRAAIVSRDSANALNGLYVDAAGPKAASDGWAVVTQGTAKLSTKSAGTDAAYANYVYAATRILPGSAIQISQWGVLETSGPDEGLVKIYTAIAKAGVAATCDWKTTPALLSQKCVVVYDVLSSIMYPPPAYVVYPDIHWKEHVNMAPWVLSGAYTKDFSTEAGATTVTEQLGQVNLNGTAANSDGSRSLRFVAVVKNLDPNKKVSIDFNKPGEQSFYGYSFTPTSSVGDGAKLERAVYGTLIVPAGTTSLDIYMDTYLTSANNGVGQTLSVSRFFLYQTIPSI